MSGNPGTSGQTLNVTGGTQNQSSTNPWPNAIPSLNNILQYAGSGGDPLSAAENANFKQAKDQVSQIPNFGPAAAQTAANYLQTGGDPTGILRRESGQIGYGANSPGMRDVLKTIQNDVSNQVNSQFAGAGRSLSGLNEQTLSRGLSQGEAVPLMNQYNQNIANQLGIQGAATQNIGQGFNFANMAPGLAQQVPMARQTLQQQQRMLPFQYLGARENLVNPIAGLGGTSQGSQQSQQAGTGTATNSLLSQLGQLGGLFQPFGGLLGTML